jgi:hypothetical protein
VDKAVYQAVAQTPTAALDGPSAACRRRRTASKRLDASGVTRLDIAHGFDVRVAIGQAETATVTYDDNLADLLDVRVDGRTLRLQLKPTAGPPTGQALVPR